MLQPLLRRYADHLVVDAGGWSERSGTQRELASQIHLEGMQELGLQVANVAGRDLDLGPEAITELSAALDLQFISANIYVSGKLRFQPYILLQKKLDGKVVRIGITGVTSPSQQAVEGWPEESHLEFKEPMAAAQAMLETLRPQTDLRILLAHVPLATLEEFARQETFGYDLLITSTGELRETTPVGETPAVLAPGTRAKHLAWVYLRHLGAGTNQITGGEVLALDAKISDDPAMSEKVADFKERLSKARAMAASPTNTGESASDAVATEDPTPEPTP